MNDQLKLALVAAGGALLGALLTFIGSVMQVRTAAKSKKQELGQAKQQAQTQMYVDHVAQRLENRRTSYLTFMQAIEQLLRLTSEDQTDRLRSTGPADEQAAVDYGQRLMDAASQIDAARDAIFLDGPQAVAGLAAELCRIPHRLAQSALDTALATVDRHAEVQAATISLRTELMREMVRFSQGASAAINLDGVGNHLDPLLSPRQG
ncbi:hypothetical protein [Streptomyces sp. NPDC058066]|uniref:hypothetical protein n=1 Tax=Streptomyces sp. NPDC058066 TaxID=3346323 RepID=UPI0036E712E4